MNLKLQFPSSDISIWAERYLKGLKSSEKELERYIEDVVAVKVKKNGYLDREDFRALCRWKGRGRTEVWCEKNEEEFIKVVTHTALSTSNERFRIVALGALKGVDWPTASVILHFCHEEPYPVLDPNALRALGLYSDLLKKYDFDLWEAYVHYCRKLIKEYDVSMRILDRALWRFGKDAPKPKKTRA